MTTRHVMIVGQSFLDGELTVECSCGWKGDGAWSNEDAAADAWSGHVRDAAPSARSGSPDGPVVVSPATTGPSPKDAA